MVDFKNLIVQKSTSHDLALKVWWVCAQSHDFNAIICARKNGQGCPYCSGRKATPDNNLMVVNPELSKEWHPNKNGRVTPKDVLPFSSKKSWWICPKGHDFDAVVSRRSLGHGCPYCSGHRASLDNCLATINPRVAEEWHSTKNGELTPNDVTAGSNKIVWWLCPKKHEFRKIINNRNKSPKCPVCLRIKAKDRKNGRHLEPSATNG